MIAISSLQELKLLANIEVNEDGFDGFIVLNHGVKSSKQIWYDRNGDVLWQVFHYIDESEAHYNSDEEFMESEPNIRDAIKDGSLISY